MGSEAQNQAPLSLDIGIIGAGIAGLATAAALARLGHNVDLYERSQFSNEIGAAVNIGPNSAPVMRLLGFDVARAKLMRVEEGVHYTADSLKETYRGQYDDFEARFNAPWYFSHRVDLHNELKRLALQPVNGAQGAKLHLGKRVTDVDCEAGVLTFDDGTTVQKDVLVGADGVHSVVANRVLGGDAPVVSVGQCAFRFLIPTKKLQANEVTKSMFEEKKCTFHIASAADRRIVWYPCRDNEIQNFVGIHPAKSGRIEKEDWHAAASVDDLLETFEGFHPTLVEVCRNAEELNLWKLLYRPPIEKWMSGKVVLLGDAAHPMLPHQGQGANQAIEDAGAVGIAFENIKSKEEIPVRLELVQEIRRNRAAAMQIFSNAGQDEAHRIEKEAAKYVKGPVPKNQGEFHQWNFGYDIVEASRQLAAQHQL